MLKTFNHLKDPQEIPADFLRAHVTVLPKPSKDPLDCASYRPISLPNVNLKLYAKIMANRLRPLLHHLIGLEQTGFMPGRKAKDNVIKALNLIHRSQTEDFEGMLLSTDAEKAFDCVSWDFLFATCTHIGLKPHMLTWIKTLYHNTTAQIKINGALSDTVVIQNGTQQGCPLSPLLFILTLEPFTPR